MCGIAGLFNLDKDIKIDTDYYLNNILNNNLLFHRGPDEKGYWKNLNNNLLLIHTRLAIQDLSPNGKQPMFSSDERSLCGSALG